MPQLTLFDEAETGCETDEDKSSEVASTITARDYQSAAVDSVFREWETVQATLLVLATGTGKTVCATMVAERVLNGEIGMPRFLFFAHRDELVQQAANTFRRANIPGAIVEVEKGTQYASNRANIVVASVQSLSQPRRLERFAPDHFGAWTMDEAHHGVRSNASYSAIRGHFKGAKGLGLTATPDRKDGIRLGEVFDTVAYTFDILDAVKAGWLVPVGQRLERCEGLDFSKIALDREGEFREGELAEQMKKEAALYALTEAAVKYSNYKGKIRPTLVFCANVDHAELVAEILNRRHAKDNTGRAAVIHCRLKPEERREILRMYKRREIRYLTNYNILSEGFDDDETRVIVNGRPMRSRALYAQVFGRATRPLAEIIPLLAACKTAEGRRAIIKASRKPGALMVDLVGLNHKLVLTMADILGGRDSDEVIQAVRDRMARTDQPVDVEAELVKQRELAAKRAAKEAAEKNRSGLVVRAKLAGRNVDPFDIFDSVSQREEGGQPINSASEAQLSFLQKCGMSGRELEGLSRTKASALIGTLMQRRKMGLCSYKVARILRRFGYDSNLSAEEASKVIETLKANGWRKPR